MSDIREDITLVTTNVGLIMSKGIAEINKTFNEGKTWVVVSTLHYQTTDSLPSSFFYLLTCYLQISDLTLIIAQ